MSSEVVNEGEDVLVGSGQVNDAQFHDLSERRAKLLRAKGDLQFRIVFQTFINDRLSGVSIDRFTHHVQDSSAKITIPRETFRKQGFEFEPGDQNVHRGGIRYERDTPNRVYATLYVTGEN